jgi:formyltetrahydrofolate deformylase
VTNSGEFGSSAARLLVVCPDRPGIVTAVSSFLFARGANITDSAQHSTDPTGGTFFMRREFLLGGSGTAARVELERAFRDEVAEPFEMEWRVSYATDGRRIALLFSQLDHCLVELLSRRRRGELAGDVAIVVSNHRSLEDTVRSFGLRFEHVPFTRERSDEADAQMLEVLAGRVDLIVLARYMRILSARS